MIPTGAYRRISFFLAVHGSTTEKTCCSRMRRAMSCEYCAPKSRKTVDWVSTHEFLRLLLDCKVLLSSGRLASKTPLRTAATLPIHCSHQFSVGSSQFT